MQTLDRPTEQPGGRRPRVSWGLGIAAGVVMVPILVLLVFSKWGVLVAAVAAFVCALGLFAFRRQFAFIEIVAFLIHFDGLGAGPIRMGRIVAAVAFIVIVRKLVVERWRPPAIPTRHWLPVLLLTIYAVLSGAWSDVSSAWFVAMGLLGLALCLLRGVGPAGRQPREDHAVPPCLLVRRALMKPLRTRSPAPKSASSAPHAMVLPTETLKASWAIDWVGRKEFDFTCKEVAEGRDLTTINGLSYKDKDGKIKHNPEREMIANMDSLPWVADVYRRDLQIEKYFIGYLLHPYVSLYTGRGCPAQCTFCLWPQTIGGHKYRVRSPQNVADEMAYMKKIFPQVREFFFDDDTFTANLPRAREIAKKLGPLGVYLELQQPRKPGLRHDQEFQRQWPAPVPRRLRKRQRRNLTRIKKGVTTEEMRKFTKACHQAGVVIHGTFILGLPVETKETIEQTIRFAQELDVFSLQVTLAAPIPARNSTTWPSSTAGSPRRTKPISWKATAFSKARWNIPA